MCSYCDCITPGPAVLTGLDALRNSESNEMNNFVTDQLPHLVFSIILGFCALTGCNAMLPLSGKAGKCSHLLTWMITSMMFVCLLYGIGEKDDRGIDDAGHSLL